MMVLLIFHNLATCVKLMLALMLAAQCSCYPLYPLSYATAQCDSVHLVIYWYLAYMYSSCSSNELLLHLFSHDLLSYCVMYVCMQYNMYGSFSFLTAAQGDHSMSCISTSQYKRTEQMEDQDHTWLQG